MRRRNGKHFLIFVQFSGFQKPWRVGADGGEGPPVPIPNTAVKPTCAENTWLEAARENKQVPTSKPQHERAAVFLCPAWAGVVKPPYAILNSS